jgi:anti-sigma factor RsiW
MTTGPHHEEELQDLLDGRLDGARRAEVEAHLAACAACDSLRLRLEAARAAVRSIGSVREVPAGLEGDVRAALDREDRAGGDVPRHRTSLRRWVAPALAAAAMLAVAVLVTRSPRPLALPAQAARDYEAIVRGTARLEVTATDATELERFFAGRGLGFRVRVLDLDMMGFALEGGSVEPFGGRPGVVYVYRNAAGDRLVCRMYAGRLEDVPPTPDTRERDGFRFLVFREGAQTVVFWQEGPVICVLVGSLPSEEVVALAFAKAMAPA